MIVFNEGVPRAGKSYDAVKNHILPTLKKGRRVFARLNGLNHERIAAYLKLPLERVQELLVLVDSQDVKSKFVAVQSVGGLWSIPDELKDSLVVIDEVHEFYVTDRAPLPPEQEQFFALIGQNGGDVVILTQWIKRVHPAVRARIERKNVFQKLTAVGLKSKYRVTFWHTISPDKYEKVGAKTETYDPSIYPLYHGYAPGAENAEVYEEGGTNVWKAMLPRLIVAVVAGAFGIWAFAGFFTRGMTASDEELPPALASPMGQGGAVPAYTAPAAVETPAQRRAREQAERLDALTPGQRYVVELAKMGRIRLAGRMDVGQAARVLIEWIDDQGTPVERLTGAQLVAMGVRVQVTDAAAMLLAGTETLVATNWPMNIVVRDTEHRLYRLDRAGPAATPSVSEPSLAAVASSTSTRGTGAAPGYGQLASYGDMGVATGSYQGKGQGR